MSLKVGMATAYLSLDISNWNKNVQAAMRDATVFGDTSKTVSDKWLSTASIMGNIGSTLTRQVTTPLAMIGKSALDAGIEFEKGLTNVKAITGATAQEIELAGEKATESSKKWGMSANDIVEAYQHVVVAGKDVTESISGFDDVIALAVATMTDLNFTAEFVGDVLMGFGEDVDQTGRYVDVFASICANANIPLEDVAESMKYAAPIASTLGYSIEELGGSVALMAEAQIKGSQAGTTLRGAMTRLAAPTKQANELLQSLGLMTGDAAAAMDDPRLKEFGAKLAKTSDEADEALGKLNATYTETGEATSSTASALEEYTKAADKQMKAQKELDKAAKKYGIELQGLNTVTHNVDGTMKSWTESMDVLRGAFANMDEAQKASAAHTLFGMNAMSGMLVVMDSAEDHYRELTGTIHNASNAYDGLGQAQGMAAEQAESMEMKIARLKAEWEALLRDAYEAAIPIIEWVIRTIQWLIDKFDGLIEAQQQSLVKWGIFLALSGPIIGWFGSVIPLVIGLINGLNGLSSVILKHSPILLEHLESVKTVTGKTKLNVLDLIKSLDIMVTSNVKKIPGMTKVINLLGGSVLKLWGAIGLVIIAMNMWQEKFPAIASLFFEIGAGVLDLMSKIGGFLGFSKEMRNEMSLLADDFRGAAIEAANEWDEQNKKVEDSFEEMFENINNITENGLEQIEQRVLQHGQTLEEGFSGTYINAQGELVNFVNISLEELERLKNEGTDINATFTSEILDDYENLRQYTSIAATDIVDGFINAFTVLIDRGDGVMVEFRNVTESQLQQWRDAGIEPIIKDVERIMVDDLEKSLTADAFKDYMLNSTEFVTQMEKNISERVNRLEKEINRNNIDIRDKSLKEWHFMTEEAKSKYKNFNEFLVKNQNEGNSKLISELNDLNNKSGKAYDVMTQKTVNQVKKQKDDILGVTKEQKEKMANMYGEQGADIIIKQQKTNQDLDKEIKKLGTMLDVTSKEGFDKVVTNVEDMGSESKQKIEEAREPMRTATFYMMNGVKSAIDSVLYDIYIMWDSALNRMASRLSTFSSDAKSAVKSVHGSHAQGLQYVPFDGYIAELHKGERVLTAQESKEYEQGSGGDTFIFQSPKALDEYTAAREFKRVKRELEFA